MQVVTADEAARLVRDEDTILIGGSGSGHAVPDTILAAIERRFLSTGSPRHLTSIHPVGLGDGSGRNGVGHLAHQGLLKRIVCGTYVDAPPISDLAMADRIEAYTLPQGALSLLTREMAAGRPGLITHVGLHTFVDPRLGGGKQSVSAKEDLVELVTLAGRDWLLYKPFKVDVALLRGTTADEDGNVTMEQEAIFGEMLSMAQATRRCGGLVVVQVKRLAKRGVLRAKDVKIPAMLVDLVVVDPHQQQTFLTDYDPAYAGELKVPLTSFSRLPLDARKIVPRRATLELFRGAICNVGSGIMTGIGLIGAEEEILDEITLTNEQGLIGGAPASGRDAGAARNYSSAIDQPYQFDFYDGGGLELAFLSCVEVDRWGNVNISRFGGRIVGIGGFIDISQNARKVVFGGTFTSGGLEVDVAGGQIRIVREGAHRKFISRVEQISFSGQYAMECGQQVLYVTERAVLRLTPAGLELVEVAPGLDVERDVLSIMEFRPAVSPQLREMDPRLFRPEPMGIAGDLARGQRRVHPRLAELGEER